MPIEHELNVIGTLFLLIYGIGSLILPFAVGNLIAQEFMEPRSVAEFRVVGGFFIGLAVFALIRNEPLLYTALGIGWLGAAGARVFATLVDRPPLEKIYLGLWLFEILMGVMLIV